MKHSRLEAGGHRRRGQLVLNMIGMALAILCVITGLWHQQTVGWDEDKTLLAISFLFAAVHLVYYLLRMVNHK